MLGLEPPQLDLWRLLEQAFYLRRAGLPDRFIVISRQGLDMKDAFNFFAGGGFEQARGRYFADAADAGGLHITYIINVFQFYALISH